MSDTGSASNSPAKPSNSSSGSPAPGSLKSRIAAFESGAASNAAKSQRDKAIPHADLSNLRSRFDREGDRPLVVKGSFGLGAPPERERDQLQQGERAVSLGSGRAVAPIQSPTVILPTPTITRTPSTTSSSAATRASSVGGASISSNYSSSSRPHSIHRSDSTNSASTTTSTSAVTANSTGSSLLPGPLAALVNQSNSSSPAASNASLGDDASGLRTPMSSISLSSMQVETGSNAGDYSASALSGEETANEDDEGLRTPGEEKSISPLPVNNDSETQGDSAKPDSDTSMTVLSAAELEQQNAHATGADREQGEERKEADASDAGARPPQDAVARAEKELADYTKESPAEAETVTPHLALPEADEGSHSPQAISPSVSPSRRKPNSRPGSFTSPKDRLRRSSTSTSLKSQPESDLGDTNLDNLVGEDDGKTAQNVAESIAPLPHGDEEPSDAPMQTPAPDPVAEVTSASNAERGLREDDISSAPAEEAFAPVDVPTAGDEDELDEEGMPKVKCSDCGTKIGLMQLGEHVCASSGQSLSPSSRGQPLDVPTDDLASPSNSPQPAHRDLPERLEAPDVPDDAMSVASIDQGRECSYCPHEHTRRVLSNSSPVCLCDLDERAAITSVPDVPTSPHSTSVVPNAGEAEEVGIEDALWADIMPGRAPAPLLLLLLLKRPTPE